MCRLSALENEDVATSPISTCALSLGHSGQNVMHAMKALEHCPERSVLAFTQGSVGAFIGWYHRAGVLKDKSLSLNNMKWHVDGVHKFLVAQMVEESAMKKTWVLFLHC